MYHVSHIQYHLCITNQLVRLKFNPRHSLQIPHSMKRSTKLFQFQQFGIIRIIKPWFNGYTVVHLIPECVEELSTSIAWNRSRPEVVSFHEEAGFSKHAMFKYFAAISPHQAQPATLLVQSLHTLVDKVMNLFNDALSKETLESLKIKLETLRETDLAWFLLFSKFKVLN